MEINTASSRMYPVLLQYDHHTKLLPNVLEGLTEKDTLNRLSSKANHIAWISGSMVHVRYELARIFGIEITDPVRELFHDEKGMKSLDESFRYPQREELIKYWNEVSPVLRQKLAAADDNELNKPDPFEMGPNMSLFDSAIYIIDRESYCIGQIGIFRRLLGYDAMKYPED